MFAALCSRRARTWAGLPFTEPEIRRLGELWFRALRALATCDAASDAAGLTPSDIPLVALSQDEIERIESMYTRD